MTLMNEIYAVGSINKAELRDLLIILNPFAPHITSEMYQTNFGGYIHEQKWVAYDDALCVDATVEIVAQVNGKVKCKLNVPADIDQSEVVALAKQDPKVSEAIEGKNIIKEIYVKGRLVNIVAK